MVVCGQENKKAHCPTQPTDQESIVVNTSEETYHAKHDSMGDVPFSGPLLPSSGVFTWIKNGKDNKPNTITNSKSCSKVLGSSEEDASNLSIPDEAVPVDTKRHDSKDIIKRCVLNQCEPPFQHPALFGGSGLCKSQNISTKLRLKNESFARNYMLVSVISWMQAICYFFLFYMIRLILMYVWYARSTRMKANELSFQGPCCRKRTKLTRFCSVMNAIFVKLYVDHGSRKVQFACSIFIQQPSH